MYWLADTLRQVARIPFNLSIYEREKSSSITKEEYIHFLNNDEKLAETYGKNIQLFSRAMQNKKV